jgi:hypothetical protein
VRVLGLGLLLFGLLYMHAASPSATVSHLAPHASASPHGVHDEPVAASESVATATSDGMAGQRPEGHHDGHGQQHAGEDCALGQPQQGPAVAVPCLSPLNPVSADGAPGSVSARRALAEGSTAPITHPANSAVLRI